MLLVFGVWGALLVGVGCSDDRKADGAIAPKYYVIYKLNPDPRYKEYCIVEMRIRHADVNVMDIKKYMVESLVQWRGDDIAESRMCAFVVVALVYETKYVAGAVFCRDSIGCNRNEIDANVQESEIVDVPVVFNGDSIYTQNQKRWVIIEQHRRRTKPAN